MYWIYSSGLKTTDFMIDGSLDLCKFEYTWSDILDANTYFFIFCCYALEQHASMIFDKIILMKCYRNKIYWKIQMAEWLILLIFKPH